MTTRLIPFVLVLVLAAAAVAPPAAEDLVATLEAEFLERFTRFIEWPSDSPVADAEKPFVIGVANRPEIRDALTRIAATTRVKGKTLVVRRLDAGTGAAACDVVFVGPDNSELLRKIVADVRGKPILVVADSRGYAKQGAMINFLTEGEFVRFEVNPKAAEAAGLRFASELLALGEVVD
jgi:hypothetical protein